MVIRACIFRIIDMSIQPHHNSLHLLIWLDRIVFGVRPASTLVLVVAAEDDVAEVGELGGDAGFANDEEFGADGDLENAENVAGGGVGAGEDLGGGDGEGEFGEFGDVGGARGGGVVGYEDAGFVFN